MREGAFRCWSTAVFGAAPSICFFVRLNWYSTVAARSPEIEDISVFPMAIPMIAGPSAMASVMLLGSQQPDRMGDWSLALALAWGATAVILFSATYLYKALGTAFLVAIERLMGMLLVAISVQMLMDGISTWLKVAPTP